MTHLKKGIRAIIILIILVGIFLISTNIYVILNSKENIKDVEELKGESFDAVLVLGCGYQENDEPSPMMADRVSYGVAAFKESATENLLMSGDGQEPNEHDEPMVMSKFAQRLGVDKEDIVEDPYGLSTYDSMWRAKYVYGLSKIVVVTQRYHLYRAVYIAKTLGLEVVGVDSTNRVYLVQLFYDIREFIARTKDFIFCIVQPELDPH